MERHAFFILVAAIVGLTACSDDESSASTSATTTSGGVGGSGVGGAGGSATGGAGATGGDGGTEAPVAPTDVTVEPLGSGLHVTWTDASDDEDNFILERQDGGGTFEEVITLPFDSTQYHDEGGLVSGTEYTYRVGATNAGGTAYSEEISNTAP